MLLSRPAGLCAALLLLFLAAVTAESVRETETMDPQLYPEEFASGDLPDDEDSRPEFTIDEEGGEELSGSGDDEDTEDVLSSVPAHPDVSVNNYIPDIKKDSKDEDSSKPFMVENEIIVPNKAVPPEEEDLSNKISMASTATGSVFERTEVLAALIAGGAVGLLFAVFLVLLLVYRMKKKDEGSYDLGKKPIYKKAPTNEFYA
ncbi:PREDICTED: syndecan-4 [Gekko japonicus]|uniref:Syndecan n=1 Tax=Gekko japonicus TaxID=146911 RepID=A0ABM1JWV8_GEKJA|nr:PREDICTED: syndecan-4 [Gekko japonicus]